MQFAAPGYLKTNLNICKSIVYVVNNFPQDNNTRL
jgi:hypothetical protein